VQRGPREVAGSLRRCPVCQGRAAGAAGVCGGCESLLQGAIEALPPAGGPQFWLGAYAGPWLRLVKALKYEGDRRVADLLGGLLARRLQAASFRPTVITHVPASPGRLHERGFDQSELLAAALAASLAASIATSGVFASGTIPTGKLLSRAQGSRSQGRLSRAERTVNAGASFTAVACRAQRVLLVDDVVTTGATAAACSAALLEAGAAEVWTALVARTVGNCAA